MEDAKLISFKYDLNAKKVHGRDQWIAIFSHPSYEAVVNGSQIPNVEVVYQAYQFEKKVEPVEPEEAIEDVAVH